MKELMKKFNRMMVYFFTPEDSSAMAGQRNLSFDLSLPDLGIGSVKALFWIMGGAGIMYLISLI